MAKAMLQDEYDRVLELYAQGLNARQIAKVVGRGYTTIYRAIDPEYHERQLKANAERKKRYQGTCQNCGGPTTGSNGRAAAPKLCIICTRKAKESKHGTRSRYMRGCGCDACREASTDWHRELRHSGQTPPHHGESGYFNYGCRCEICRAAGSARNHFQYEVRKKRAANG